MRAMAVHEQKLEQFLAHIDPNVLRPFKQAVETAINDIYQAVDQTGRDFP